MKKTYQNKLSKLIVYTDGSCLGNPGPGGWAFLILEQKNTSQFDELYSSFGGESHTTNNRMEMQAIIKAMQYLLSNYPKHQSTLYSDSNLIIQTINQGWKKKANTDLWLEIDQLREKLSIDFQWVKGHSVDRFNHQCDLLAQKAAQKFK